MFEFQAGFLEPSEFRFPSSKQSFLKQSSRQRELFRTTESRKKLVHPVNPLVSQALHRRHSRVSFSKLLMERDRPEPVQLDYSRKSFELPVLAKPTFKAIGKPAPSIASHLSPPSLRNYFQNTSRFLLMPQDQSWRTSPRHLPGHQAGPKRLTVFTRRGSYQTGLVASIGSQP